MNEQVVHKLGESLSALHRTLLKLIHWQMAQKNGRMFGEDQSRARTLNAAKNLGLLRNMALNILRQDSSKKSLQRKMYAASLQPDTIKSWPGF